MTNAIYPDSFAAMNAHRAGQKYRPSNGTEGECFIAAWCFKCQRDKAMREGANFDECDDDERCEIIGLTMIHSIDDPEFPDAWQYGQDGQPCCTQFVPVGEPVPAPRCTQTMELF